MSTPANSNEGLRMSVYEKMSKNYFQRCGSNYTIDGNCPTEGPTDEIFTAIFMPQIINLSISLLTTVTSVTI